MMRTKKLPIVLFFAVFVFAGCATVSKTTAQLSEISLGSSKKVERPALAEIESPEIRKMIKSANEQIKTVTGYTQKYFNISYPNGDVPSDTGACTDVVIRSFRAAGVDLQKEVHEDMSSAFSSYPQKWGLRRPDSNIDHRRVPNLHKYFERKGKSIEITEDGSKYLPGDVVAWDLNGRGMTHIGVVSNIWSEAEKRYLIIHNIGSGTKLEDRLFDWSIIGHYRYFEAT